MHQWVNKYRQGVHSDVYSDVYSSCSSVSDEPSASWGKQLNAASSSREADVRSKRSENPQTINKSINFPV